MILEHRLDPIMQAEYPASYLPAPPASHVAAEPCSMPDIAMSRDQGDTVILIALLLGAFCWLAGYLAGLSDSESP